MNQQERKPIDITKEFPVRKQFLLYCQDGYSLNWGRWSATVKSLDLNKEEITLDISQDWEGAAHPYGLYWYETRTIKFKDFIIPILGQNE